MSTIKSSDEHLTLNADGSSKDIKFQANGVEKASISSSGAFTSTTIDATKLTGNLPAISGANLTGLSASDSTKLPLAGGTITGLLKVYPSNGQMRIADSNGDNKYAELEASNGRLFLHSDKSNAEANSDMRFYIDNTERMRIDSSGYVLANKMATSYATCIGPSGNSNHSSALNIMRVAENPDSLYNASNGKFTCPIDGLYFMSAMSINTASINNTIQALALKNGSEISGVGRMYESQNHNHGGSATCGYTRCSAGDYLQWQWHGSIYDGQHSNATFALIHGET